MEVIFIDNDSPDKSGLEFVRENYGSVRIVANEENSGYAGAANQGIGLAKGDYVMITNPDIIFEPNYFEKAAERMEKDEMVVGVLG